MDDLISRRAAIEAMNADNLNRNMDSVFDDDLRRAARAAQRALARIPAAQRWIPVTERPPDSRAWVLCKCRANIHEVLSWRDGGWYHDPQHRYMRGFVTHWMPLPSTEGLNEA